MKKTILSFEKKQIKPTQLKAIKGGHNGKGTKRAASSARGKPELL
ncbi:MAG: hypothetical protein ACPG4Y_10325 [Chitinophagales bacterium]